MELNIKKKMFYTFLIINFIAWTLIQLCRNVISIDSMEAVSWGEVMDFGTNKHPPFSGWLMGGFYHLFGQHDFIAYILGQVCLLIGYIFLYKLAKFFMSKEKAMCASMILSSCYYYTYILFIDNFNCNFVSMGLIPMIAYYFYKSIKHEKTKDWVIFGVLAAIAALTKYQTVFLFIALFLYLIIYDRRQFLKKGMYISIIIGFLLILPHIIWLFKTDFFSFAYMIGRTEIGTHNTPSFLLPFARIVFPIKFVLDQILSVITCIIVYLFLGWQSKNISYAKDSISKSDKGFILLITLAPMILQGCVAILTGSRIQGIWGSIMVCFTGILLFALFPINFNKDTFKYFMKWTYSLVILWLTAVGIFVLFQTKRIISYPYQTIMPEFNKLWDTKTGNAPLKYVGGSIDYVFQFHLYNKRHPKVILETFGHSNPWVDPKDVLSSGLIVFGDKQENVIKNAHALSPLLPENYKTETLPYSFEVKNIINKKREYTFYYAIIPPLKND